MIGRSAVVAAIALLTVAGRATPSHAHAVGVSRGEYRVDGQRVRADLILARPELLSALPGIDADRDGEVTVAELDGSRQIVSAWIGRGLTVRVANTPCAGTLERAALTEQDGVELTAAYECPSDAATISIELGLLSELSLGHRHVATIVTASETTHAVLFEAAPTLAVGGERAELRRVGSSLFRLGIEHSVTGYDHLLFLLALLLVGGTLRSAVLVLAAFTLAHSVTLAVAALGIWTPETRLVAPAIALSIAYVGVANCAAPDLRRRWRLGFLFGLVHGFGFASALRNVAVSAVHPIGLASFNLGVEAGQLAVLAVILPSVWWLGRRAWFARGGLRLASLTISGIGLVWFAVRVTG